MRDQPSAREVIAPHQGQRGRQALPLAPGDGDELSPREAASFLHLSERSIRRAIAAGTLPASKQGESYRIPRQAVLRFAAGLGLTRAPGPAAAPLVVLPQPADTVAPLPESLSSIVGREADVAVIIDLLTDPTVRLLTLTGPGGIGKTRLATAAAAAVNAHFPDGVAFIALETIQRTEQVVPAIARALGLREQRTQTPHQQLQTLLRQKQLLLVLDNFEQILPAGADVLALLAAARQVKVLITSRAPLRVTGERELPVPPLTLASNQATVAELLASGAGSLFVERARDTAPSFALDEQTAPLVAAICAQLDGLPLAIELAAARITVLTPRQLQARLEHRLPLLTRGARSAPSRHRTMRDAIAWSYELLSPEEQRLFRHLSVFTGGATLEAAERVAGTSRGVEESRSRGGDGETASRHERLSPRHPDTLTPITPSPITHPPSPHLPITPPSVLDSLSTLLEQSLLISETGTDGEPRFRPLEMLREFGLEQLEATGELDLARTAHARYFLDLARALRPLVSTQAMQAPLDRLAAEHANLLAALEWLDAQGPAEDFAALVAALGQFWYAFSLFREGRTWLERALAHVEAASALDRGRLYLGSAVVLIGQGELSQSEPLLALAVGLLGSDSDPLEASLAHVFHGGALALAGRASEAEPAFRAALAEAERIADPVLRAGMGGRALANLGAAVWIQGDLAGVEAYCEAALRGYDDLGLDLGESTTLMDLGSIAYHKGEHALAVERWLESITLMRAWGQMRRFADALSGIACVATAWEDPRAALLLFGAADEVRERYGTVMIWPWDVAAVERSLATLRDALGDVQVETTLAEGRTLSLAEAIAVAAAVASHTHATVDTTSSARATTPLETTRADDSPATPPTPTVTLDPALQTLTRREWEVLLQMAQDKSDGEIAAALFLSRRTVNWHVHSILLKVSASSRSDAVALARRNGVV